MLCSVSAHAEIERACACESLFPNCCAAIFPSLRDRISHKDHVHWRGFARTANDFGLSRKDSIVRSRGRGYCRLLTGENGSHGEEAGQKNRTAKQTRHNGGWNGHWGEVRRLGQFETLRTANENPMCPLFCNESLEFYKDLSLSPAFLCRFQIVAIGESITPVLRRKLARLGDLHFKLILLAKFRNFFSM